MSLAPRALLGAQVAQVIAVAVAVAQHLSLGVMQRRIQLIEDTYPALTRELVPQTPGSAAERGEPVVVGCPWGHPTQKKTSAWSAAGNGMAALQKNKDREDCVSHSPQCNGVEVSADGRCKAPEPVRNIRVLHEPDMQPPKLLGRPASRAIHAHDIQGQRIGSEAVGKSKAGLSALMQGEFANLCLPCWRNQGQPGIRLRAGLDVVDLRHVGGRLCLLLPSLLDCNRRQNRWGKSFFFFSGFDLAFGGQSEKGKGISCNHKKVGTQSPRGKNRAEGLKKHGEKLAAHLFGSCLCFFS